MAGESDRANRVIDAVKARDIEERLELANEHFADLQGLYETAEDGYVRESVIRVIEHLIPDIVAVVALQEGGRLSTDPESVRERTDVMQDFLLMAITDDDGRVRQAARRALKNVSRTFDAFGDEEAIISLANELDEIADTAESDIRNHALEAKNSVLFFAK